MLSLSLYLFPSRCSFQPQFLKLCLDIIAILMKIATGYWTVADTIAYIRYYTCCCFCCWFFFWKSHLLDDIANRKCVAAVFLRFFFRFRKHLLCLNALLFRFHHIYLLLFRAILYVIDIRPDTVSIWTNTCGMLSALCTHIWFMCQIC